MFSLTLSGFAASSASLCNLLFRLNSGARDSANGLLSCHYLVSFLLALYICYDITTVPFSTPIAAIGVVVGFLNILLMLVTHRALQCGPSGLAYALQNASCLFPGLVLFTLYGEKLGFTFSWQQGIGMGLVFIGFFLAARSTRSSAVISRSWLFFAGAGFLIQIAALSLIQWRCLLWKSDCSHPLIPTSTNIESDVWFMPALFGAAALLQLCLFMREKRLWHCAEIFLGLATGTANGLSTYLLSLATKWAAPTETAFIFPLFAVITIIFCNSWANKLYGERFDILSNTLCSLGIFIAFTL